MLWSEILKRVPLEAQNCLLLGMSNGSEISVQDLLRIENTHVLLRGRVGGTTDSGRVFCIPFQQITYSCFTRTLPQPMLAQIFGELLRSLEDDGPLRDADEPELAPEEPSPESLPEVEALPAPMRIEPAAPSTIRDRLRARLATASDKRTS